MISQNASPATRKACRRLSSGIPSSASSRPARRAGSRENGTSASASSHAAQLSETSSTNSSWLSAAFPLHSGREPARGRAAIREAAAGTFALVPDLAFHLVSLRVGDDFWVVRWQLTGTSATGRDVCVDLADFVLVEDGAVKEKHSYVDGVAMQATLA
ncbi:ester cyclase [Nocardia flavorosea]|uniref:Ester cyclase n=1 Tax=Nocardia flavorosea TaxID=53429 RepID=A0A846Y6H4_9NOCA|nr:ester cyclase [Nocardia flavorosea]NKY55166.1 ester cyclase [Nocardia flavorosea]